MPRCYCVVVVIAAGAALPGLACADLIVSTATEGGTVRRFTDSGGAMLGEFQPYGPGFTGGVRIAAGRVNLDLVDDLVTAPGPGAAPQVKVFDGFSGGPIRNFLAYDGGFSGGVYVAAGDVNGDSRADIITGAGAGAGPHVKAFSGANGSELSSFFAYGGSVTNGVSVAAGDVDGDGFADLISGVGAGAGPHVKAFRADAFELRSFFAFGGGFTGGVRVASGDVNGDTVDDFIVGAGPGGNGHVMVFDGLTLDVRMSFFAYGANFDGGVSVAAGDIDGDGNADIITGALAAPGGTVAPHVKVFRGGNGDVLSSFLAYDGDFTGGVEVGYFVPAPGAAGVVLLVVGGLARRRR
ncbi:MAG TPA: hypothetical protein VG797_05740 [Phycisphaerales bacterium]|nr:hypothetical protein [Phycisphaerales bacterium]